MKLYHKRKTMKGEINKTIALCMVKVLYRR